MKTYKLVFTEEQYSAVRQDILLKVMGGKIEYDVTARVVGKLMNDQIESKNQYKRKRSK